MARSDHGLHQMEVIANLRDGSLRPPLIEHSGFNAGQRFPPRQERKKLFTARDYPFGLPTILPDSVGERRTLQTLAFAAAAAWHVECTIEVVLRKENNNESQDES